MAAKGQAGALIIVATLWAGGAQAECSASSLQWMLGKWSSTDDKGTRYDHWQAGAAGEMIGFSWGPNHVHPGDIIVLSAIAIEGGHLILRERHFDGHLAGASEGIDDAITFSAVSCDGRSVKFEGIGKWAGGDISYSRDGGRIVVEGHAHDNGRPGHFHTVMERE